ncbi:hypothetical protein QO002_002775 [Pararhizobium capsulatum DSM 1112]|uniref:DUF4239 domain-containing protein n=1 Tax=Pararhizobium capsulatum DSM 1112 TaxID=1121113 RepID=A0ABU0BQW8_9HYPH|nr:hypothetical protein [Pararhizobium capsulatum]MDQ0320637.1 hypothetical protein [Pararhizobium capsulatum DSM 1112]
MAELLTAAGVFVLLAAASLLSLKYSPRLASRHRSDETNNVVRLVANIFVVMTSLVFGLLINSSKNTYESIDSNVHAYATSLILLDRTLRDVGYVGRDARSHLSDYVTAAIIRPARSEDTARNDKTAENALRSLGAAIEAITPLTAPQTGILAEIRQQYFQIVEQRWKIIEQSEGVIPRPLITMLVAWLTVIFASFGYRAPHNMVVVSTLIISALLISASLYLVLDMDIPFTGIIQISDAPLQRVMQELQGS